MKLKIFNFIIWILSVWKKPHDFHKESIPAHVAEVTIIVAFATKDRATRIAALLHDLGKIHGSEDHARVGAEMLPKFLSPKDKDFEEIKILVEYHMLPSIIVGVWSTPEAKKSAKEQLEQLPQAIQKKLWLIAKADGVATHH